MDAIQVKNMGVKFLLRHQGGNTLLESTINLLTGRKRNAVPVSGNEQFWALKNVTFSVEKGESLAIVGRNGAGKSTLLQVLTGIYQPDEGTVEKEGTVGLLSLGTGFHQDLTGRENIYLNGAILGFKKREIDARYDAIVDFAELNRFIDTPIKNYSSGMVSRLGFSIAINIQPDILLIDEVLSVGDESFREKCGKALEGLRADGKTIVLVSHSMTDVRRICDRIVCLDHGELIKDGNTREVADFYMKMIGKA